jgi:hypothetical protein
MRLAVLIVGIVLTLLSCCAAGISTSLPIINGPHTSWNEAMMGIIPASICSVLSLVIAVVGLVLVLMAPKTDARTKGTPRPEDRSDEDD